METRRNKVALVTGAGRRVGASIAERLAEDGFQLAIHYRNSQDGAQDTLAKVETAGSSGALFQADLDTEGEAEKLVARVIEHFGSLDLLVPSAANFLTEPWEGPSDDIWKQSLRTNLEAPRLLARHATPHLRASRGAIVFLTCASTAIPYAHYPSYIVSKGALSHLMRVLTLELAPEIRVNAVAPGTVLPPPGATDLLRNQWAKEVPLQRIGSAKDVADAVAFLAGAAFVTGQELRIDGGYSLRPLPSQP